MTCIPLVSNTNERQTKVNRKQVTVYKKTIFVNGGRLVGLDDYSVNAGRQQQIPLFHGSLRHAVKLLSLLTVRDDRVSPLTDDVPTVVDSVRLGVRGGSSGGTSLSSLSLSHNIRRRLSGVSLSETVTTCHKHKCHFQQVQFLIHVTDLTSQTLLLPSINQHVLQIYDLQCSQCMDLTG